MHLIIGAGAVGTVLAGCLLNAGEQVTLVIPQGRLGWYKQASRLKVDNHLHQPRYRFPPPKITEIGDSTALEGVTHIYLATKYSGLNDALSWLASQPLPDELQIISCLNGVSDKHQAANQLGRSIEHMTVMFNARRDAALEAALTTKEIIQVENPQSQLGKVFAAGGAIVQKGSASGMWGKLLINLNNSICAICNASFQEMFTNAELRAIYIAVLDEAIPLLNKHQIIFTLPMPLSWRQFRWLLNNASWALSFAAKHLNGLTTESVPSMVADMRARRVTEVNHLNGEFVRLASAIDESAPLNQLIIDIVTALETGDSYRPISPSELKHALGL